MRIKKPRKKTTRRSAIYFAKEAYKSLVQNGYHTPHFTALHTVGKDNVAYRFERGDKTVMLSLDGTLVWAG